ncbi:MAG TPA: sulfurtransferase FdhD, partial [Lysinibacillus sp.]|nr:sulfurtransferase FdhD [Lysinibacillus sp.]
MERAVTRKIVRVQGQQVKEIDDLIVSEYAV